MTFSIKLLFQQPNDWNVFCSRLMAKISTLAITEEGMGIKDPLILLRWQWKYKEKVILLLSDSGKEHVYIMLTDLSSDFPCISVGHVINVTGYKGKTKTLLPEGKRQTQSLLQSKAFEIRNSVVCPSSLIEWRCLIYTNLNTIHLLKNACQAYVH